MNGFTTRIHTDKQGGHIPGHKNYIPGKSVLHLSIVEVQRLVGEHAGSGRWREPNREAVDFGQNIGTWMSPDGEDRFPTSRGIIHYSKTGCHIVPARPAKKD